MFNGQREGKDIQKYSVLLKIVYLVVVRGCRCAPDSDNEGALQLTQHHNVRAEWQGVGRATGEP